MTALPTNNRLNSDYYVEGIATIFENPYLLYKFDGVEYYERVSSKAFDGADMSDVIFQYDHSGRVLARMSNGTLIVEALPSGLLVAADLSRSNAAKDIYNDIKERLVTKMSWAFSIAEDSYDKNTRTRTILKVDKVYDVSAVSMPANDATAISARSYAEGRHSADREEFLRRRKLQLMIELEENL